MRAIMILFLLAILPLWGIRAEGQARLEAIYVEMERNTFASDFPERADLLLREAKANEDRRFESLGYYAKLYSSCMNYKVDSAIYWYDKLDSVARLNKDYPLLFFGKYMLIGLYSQRNEIGVALSEADKASEEAKQLNDPLCEGIAYLAFANIYMATDHHQEALDMARMAFLGKLPTGHFSSFDMLAFSVLLNTYRSLEDWDSVCSYLRYLDTYQDENPGVHDPDDHTYIPFTSSMVSFDRYFNYVLLCLGRNETDQAEKYLLAMEELVEGSTNVYCKVHQLGLSVAYDMATHDSDGAFQTLDAIISMSKEIGSKSLAATCMRHKADLLCEQGKDREALPLYHRAIYLNDSIDPDSYTRQIGRFNARLRSEKMEMENRQLREQKRLLYGSIIVLLTLCVAIGVVFLILNRLKRKLKEAKSSAEKSERLKSMFLANMNHEIRTPLNAVTGFCDLLAEETDTEICQEYIEIIRDNNEMLYRLLSDVLDISKIESGTITFSYSEVALPDLMRSVYQTLSLRMEEGVTLALDSSPDIKMYVDGGRLIQILTNFLTNAIKHTAEGSIHFGYEQQGENVYFYVKDTGKGIPKKEQENIFTRFVQGKEQKGGVGLGLALCRGFVLKMGGRIGVESEVGKGSTFWFILPIHVS